MYTCKERCFNWTGVAGRWWLSSMRKLASQSLVNSIDREGPLEKVNKAATKTASTQGNLQEFFRRQTNSKPQRNKVPGWSNSQSTTISLHHTQKHDLKHQTEQVRYEKENWMCPLSFWETHKGSSLKISEPWISSCPHGTRT